MKFTYEIIFIILLTITVVLTIQYGYPVFNILFFLAHILTSLHEKWISYKYGSVLPNSCEPSEIVIINDPVTCYDVIQQLLSKIRKYSVIGLDCEWVSNPHRRPVALLQLATSDGFCGLIRLFKFSHIPLNLKTLLEDTSVIKVGSAVTSDAKWLRNDYQIYVSGCVNIHRAAETVGVAGGSLKRMAKDVLDLTLNKHWTVQCSNWEADELSATQIKYAALDALVSLKILEEIIRKKVNKVNLREAEAQHHFLNLWSCIIDDCSSFKPSAKKTLTANQNTKFKPTAEKAVSIKGILYGNCRLQDPQGNLLCVCDSKKLDWYLKRNLGVEIAESPRTVRLNFKPKEFNRSGDALYYLLQKENKCVVCGSVNLLRRKYVVPCEYRSHFPREMKAYKSHDVVLLCSFCHRESVLRDQKLRKKLAIKCCAPVEQIALTEEARAINKLKYTANALLKKDSGISPARIEELKETIRSQEKCVEVTEELLCDIMSRNVPTNTISESHGEKVVNHYRSLNKLNKLEVKWRRHFVESMKPQYLPQLWSVSHNPPPLEIRHKMPSQHVP